MSKLKVSIINKLKITSRTRKFITFEILQMID